ncbi:MAG: penicillin-binding protein 2 [Candidatus Omnitrophica bacterium]|nr:penicillin-binding protein 2 [Candidatus Omnitrophota bacterium]
MRLNILNFCLAVLFIFLTAGLFFTQVVRGSYYRTLSESNRVRLVPLEGIRGGIYDRNGVPLVENTPALEVLLIPQELPVLPKDRNQTFANLEKALGISQKKLKDDCKRKGNLPFTIIPAIDKKKALYLEQHHLNLPGIMVRPKVKRTYLYREAIGHPIGYLGKISQEELDVLKKYGYQSFDRVGRVGVERVFDESLKGNTGGMLMEVDSAGRQKQVLGFQDPSEGKNLKITIDIRLQKYIYQLMDGKKGAVAVLEPASGEILAMVSAPSFDPNIFITPGSDKEIKRVLESKDRRLLNRALSSSYPPGSVFKIVTAYAGLKSGKITRDTKFYCDGSYRLGDTRFSCTSAHGMVDVEDALRYSCNIFFYHTGAVVGVDLISHYAKEFGFGKTTGIELWEEANGILPNRMWKRWRFREMWYPGDTINLSIGQGYLQATPLQIAHMVAILVNGGITVETHLVSNIGDSKFERLPARNPYFSRSVAGIVQNGLWKVVSAEGGTGHRAAVEGVEVCGKTGTAESGAGKENHSWFAGYAPRKNPKVAFAVFVEHGGKGGIAAAEVAGRMLEFMKESGML